MQVQPLSKSERSLSVMMSNTSIQRTPDLLSHKLENTLKNLAEIVAVAFGVIAESSQLKDALLSYAQQLDDILLQLWVWSRDINIRGPRAEGKPLSLREWTTLDCLNILDAGRRPAVANLRRNFDQMIEDTGNISGILTSISSTTNAIRTSVNQSLDDAISSLRHSIHDLDKQKGIIQEQIAAATVREVQSALNGSGDLPAKSSLLTLDGGGVRSYSSILIIRALMEQVCFLFGIGDDVQEHTANKLRPGDIFEYIIGSSSGGLIAIMLGRLSMTVDECLETYRKQLDNVFGHPQRRLRTLGGLLSPKYKSDHLVRTIRLVTRGFTEEGDIEKWKHSLFASPKTKCKTGVIASNCKDGNNVPYIFRTYDSPRREGRDFHRNPGSAAKCTIWEAARATSAAPQYFPSMNIEGNTFVDGGFGTNNPTFEAFKELTCSDVDSPTEPLVISIGSGFSRHRSNLKQSKFRPKFVSTAYSALDLATETETVHEDMLAVAENRKFEYFRFNVDEGLEDILLDSWKVRRTDGRESLETISHIAFMTAKYLERQDVQEKLCRCAQLLVNRFRAQASILPWRRPPDFFYVPFSRDKDFVGREVVLDRLDKGYSTNIRMALAGLGGVGKSQIAIEYCYRFKGRHSESFVFWIDAGTRAGFTNGYRKIADLAKIPGRHDAGADILQLVCTWLRRQQRNKWLLVIDNADYSVAFSHGPKEELYAGLETVNDSASPFFKFIPETRNGFVLITSRSKTIARRLSGDITTVLTVEPMPLYDARFLLHIQLAADEDVEDEDQLLETLSRIPLALKQAAAYINRDAPRMTVKKYLQELLQGGIAQTELLYPGFSDVLGDPNTAKSIGQTWQLVLYHIREMAPSSILLLSLASLFDPDGIHQYLLMHYDDGQTATSGYQRKREDRFEKDISILKSYSLLNEHGDSYVMHRLVQSWLKVWLQRRNELENWKVKFLFILSEAFPRDPHKDMARCKTLFPHAVLAIDYRPNDVKHLELYATVLGNASSYAREMKNYKMAQTMSEKAFRCSAESPSAGNSLILDRAQNLASILEVQSKWKPATDLIHHLYEERIESLGRHDPDTLACAASLSSLLVRQGKIEQSLALMEGVLKECEPALGPKHPDTLLIMSAVSSAYEGMGQVDKSIALQKTVVETMKETIGVEHPSTLSAMHQLARILLFQHSSEEAERLERQVSQTRQRVLGSEHPDTLSAMAHLAEIMYAQNRSEEAKSLERAVTLIREKVVSEASPAPLKALKLPPRPVKAREEKFAKPYQQTHSAEKEPLRQRETMFQEQQSETKERNTLSRSDDSS